MANLTLHLSSLHGTPIFTLSSSNASWSNIYGATFLRKQRIWCFPAFYPVHEFVLKDLRALNIPFSLSSEAEQHIRELADGVSLPEDFSFITTPYQHQREGLEHLLRHLRAGLFFSPGLGKCKVVIDLLRITGDKALILCPRVMLDTWKEELKLHGSIEDVQLISGASKKKKIEAIEKATANGPTASIVTFETAALYKEDLFKIPYSCIVADESHRLKSPFSNRTKAAQYLAARAYRRILLSGTPSLGSPFDLYGQLRFLGKYFCPEDWWKFRKKFGVYPEWERNEPVPKMLLGFKNVHIMNERANLICVRKTKEECLDLPEQQFIDKVFGLYPRQKKQYNELIDNRADAVGVQLREEIEDGKLDNSSGPVMPAHLITDEVITLLGKLDQVASGFLNKTTENPVLCNNCPKVEHCTDQRIRPYTTQCEVVSKKPPATVEKSKENARLDLFRDLIESILEEETNKVIVWANYTEEIRQIETALKKAKIGFVKVSGGTSDQQLSASVNKFNNDKDCRVYLGQVSTGIGITLNAANYVIYYNLPWNLEHYLQSLDRNYRIGQKRSVVVYRLVAKHTLDEAKLVALDNKIALDRLVTNSLPCLSCPEFKKRCAKHNIKLYDSDCIYDRTMLKHKAIIERIP
jgi:SNF2 family DNA or RNA helicase